MRTLSHYMIITEDGGQAMATAVCKSLRDGFELHGGVSIAVTPTRVLYAQVMVKYTDGIGPVAQAEVSQGMVKFDGPDPA